MKRKNLLIIICAMFLFVLTGCVLEGGNTSIDLELKFKDAVFMYDGNVHEIELEGEISEEYKVVYENNAGKGVGVYNATAKIYEADTDKLVEEYSAKMTIETTFESESHIVDGTTFKHELDCEVAEGFELVYSNNEGSAQGKYYSKAELIDSSSKEVVDTYYGIMTIDNPKNEEFELFMDDMLIELFAGDQMSINFFFNDYKAYGIEHQEAAISKYVKSENWEKDQEELKVLIDEVKALDELTLSYEQEDTLDIVVDYLEYIYSITERMNYMGNSFIGSYLGYQSNLPLELAEYKFREEQDIIDFISYLESTLEAFESYYQYTEDQIEYGTATPNYVIDNVISQCEEFVAMGEDNFLIGIFNDKIDGISFETKQHSVEEYKAMAKAAIVGNMTDAYQYLADNLPNLKDKATIDGGLAQYGEEGLAYYEIQMENVLGVEDFDSEEAMKFLERKVNSVYNEIMDVISNAQRLSSNEYNKFVAAATGMGPNYSNYTFDELIEYFEEISKQLVPELDEMPEITIKNVPDSLVDSFSPAAYFVSPIDETRFESIYLNPRYTSDYNYIFTTLAHEGYPGHLYQNVYSKSLDINDVRKVIRCKGYMEGWATYVEQEAYYFATNYTSQAQRYALQYNELNNAYGLFINALCDLAIHYKGYNLEEFAAYLSKILGYEYSTSDAEPIYQQLAEIPTNMSMYAISYAILDELNNLAEDKLGELFDEVAFNKVILDSGAAPFDMVIENVYEYINDTWYQVHGELLYN